MSGLSKTGDTVWMTKGGHVRLDKGSRSKAKYRDGKFRGFKRLTGWELTWKVGLGAGYRDPATGRRGWTVKLAWRPKVRKPGALVSYPLATVLVTRNANHGVYPGWWV